ncbi:MAG TPA: phosphoribosylglycinamide formyltransferase, partial [Afifellaceae bacterium]|nr:phosphoribosylglycinamide formyltransferase [Afifellaceae bacterium]
FPAEITLVVSNNADAGGLDYARANDIPTAVIDHRDYDSREAFEAALTEVLKAVGAEVVCLAGFMRLLTDTFVDEWRNRLINVHPSLLPAFKGLNTHARALSAGVRIHGASVHFVRPSMDEGPIIIQAAVPVEADDTEQTLADRVLAVEHQIYPMALSWVASQRARIVSEKVVITGDSKTGQTLIVPRPKD